MYQNNQNYLSLKMTGLRTGPLFKYTNPSKNNNKQTNTDATSYLYMCIDINVPLCIKHTSAGSVSIAWS